MVKHRHKVDQGTVCDSLMWVYDPMTLHKRYFTETDDPKRTKCQKLNLL